MARGRRNESRRGEAGFTVLEAVIALSITLGVALAAVETFSASRQAAASAKAHASALAAAEAALARIGADLPAQPGSWETEAAGVRVRIELTPFEAKAKPVGREEDGLSIAATSDEDLDGEPEDRGRPQRARPLLAVAVADARDADGRFKTARLSGIVIGPVDPAGGGR